MTQCPIRAGVQYTYRFPVTGDLQYGTYVRLFLSRAQEAQKADTKCTARRSGGTLIGALCTSTASLDLSLCTLAMTRLSAAATLTSTRCALLPLPPASSRQ